MGSDLLEQGVEDDDALVLAEAVPKSYTGQGRATHISIGWSGDLVHRATHAMTGQASTCTGRNGGWRRTTPQDSRHKER